jgi:uncharacterized protein (DUF1778 family)
MRKRASTDRTLRGITINLRADTATRTLIDRAAEQVGKNRSEFMLEAARREATRVLLDQRLFLLDEKAYARFTAALDQPPTENRRLRRLLTTKAVWDK